MPQRIFFHFLFVCLVFDAHLNCLWIRIVSHSFHLEKFLFDLYCNALLYLCHGSILLSALYSAHVQSPFSKIKQINTSRKWSKPKRPIEPKEVWNRLIVSNKKNSIAKIFIKIYYFRPIASKYTQLSVWSFAYKSLAPQMVCKNKTKHTEIRSNEMKTK